jgi:hypothetical protein
MFHTFFEGTYKMSRSKFKRLLRILDKDRGGQVDEQELKEFLFDDDYEWPNKDGNDSGDGATDEKVNIEI